MPIEGGLSIRFAAAFVPTRMVSRADQAQKSNRDMCSIFWGVGELTLLIGRFTVNCLVNSFRLRGTRYGSSSRSSAAD